MPPSQCSLSWFVKKPVYLSVSQSDPSDLTHSGVAVIDVMFPTVSSFPFSQMSFKNNYTAFITLKVKCKDSTNGSQTSKTPQQSNSSGVTMVGREPSREALQTSAGISKITSKWKTVLKNFPLMPNPNSEEGSQKTFVITRDVMRQFSRDVVQFRLIIRQPSPYWTNFDIENLHFEQEAKNNQDHNSALAHSLVTTLKEISEQNKDSSTKNPEQEDSNSQEISSLSKTTKPQNSRRGLELRAEKVGSILQNMWALTELYSRVKHTETIGRFDVEGSYEINLLSYN